MLLAELERIGVEGRKKMVDEWAPFLPTYADPFTIIGPSVGVATNSASAQGSSSGGQAHSGGAESGNCAGRPPGDIDTEEDHEEEDDGEGDIIFTIFFYFISEFIGT